MSFAEKEQFILITGNPVDGFLYIGTFSTVEDAQEYGHMHIKNESFWVHLLDAPSY